MPPAQKSLTVAIAEQQQRQLVPGDDGHWAAVFILTGGGKLFVSAGGLRRKLQISTSLLDDLRNHRPWPRCYRAGESPKTGTNLSATKSVPRIVADSNQRQIPESTHGGGDLYRTEGQARRLPRPADAGLGPGCSHFGSVVQARHGYWRMKHACISGGRLPIGKPFGTTIVSLNSARFQRAHPHRDGCH